MSYISPQSKKSTRISSAVLAGQLILRLHLINITRHFHQVIDKEILYCMINIDKINSRDMGATVDSALFVVTDYTPSDFL